MSKFLEPETFKRLIIIWINTLNLLEPFVLSYVVMLILSLNFFIHGTVKVHPIDQNEEPSLQIRRQFLAH